MKINEGSGSHLRSMGQLEPIDEFSGINVKDPLKRVPTKTSDINRSASRESQLMNSPPLKQASIRSDRLSVGKPMGR